MALIGQLGTGKTTFTKGIAKGLKVHDAQHVNSPSFVLIKEYQGRFPLYHFDFYRLNSFSARDVAWYEEYFFGRGISVVEWAEKAKGILPAERLEIDFFFKDRTKREINLRPRGGRYADLLKRI